MGSVGNNLRDRCSNQPEIPILQNVKNVHINSLLVGVGSSSRVPALGGRLMKLSMPGVCRQGGGVE